MSHLFRHFDGMRPTLFPRYQCRNLRFSSDRSIGLRQSTALRRCAIILQDRVSTTVMSNSEFLIGQSLRASATSIEQLSPSGIARDEAWTPTVKGRNITPSGIVKWVYDVRNVLETYWRSIRSYFLFPFTLHRDNILAIPLLSVCVLLLTLSSRTLQRPCMNRSREHALYEKPPSIYAPFCTTSKIKSRASSTPLFDPTISIASPLP